MHKCKCKCRGLYSEIPVSSADFTIYTPGIGTLSYMVSSHLGRIKHIFCRWCHSYFSNFRSTRYPSLLGGQRQHGMRDFAQHLYTLINFSDLRELVNFPCATIGVGDCKANQSSWHEAFVLQEGPLNWWRQVRCTTVQRLLAVCLAVCGIALSPPWKERGLLCDRRMVYALDHNP